MTGSEQREAARQFINRWRGKGKEDEDGRSYWIELLSNVFGVENVTERIDFEKKVVVDGNTKRIDVYIPETRVIIEQKSLNIPLDKKIRNSGDIDLTPFEQADRYNSKLIFDERARWIVTCNFSEIWIYDMNEKQPEPSKIMLEELQTKYSLLDFLIKKEVQKISHEMEVSIKAGDIVGLLYNAFLEQYKIPEAKKNETEVEKEKREHKLKSLNALCVRLVFCLYAEDAGIFGEKHNMFHDYLAHYEARDCRRALIELFKVLDTEEEDREDYLEEELAQFPYVNGGLFADESVEIPQFTEEIRELLLTKASEEFNWKDISPTIFGAVFESTLNPETRRHGGMHYTSVENIHKVIDPLFMDELEGEFETIQTYKTLNVKRKKLMDFQEKLAHLKFLDPACGSGNFLTETYLSLRRLENKVLRVLYGEGQGVLGVGYVEKGSIPGDSIMLAIGANYYHFGVICSNVHMAWTRVVCGRLKGDYRYSSDIVYNNFPWPSPNAEQKDRIEKTAKGIIEARELYKDCSYDELYDPVLMPLELRKAHIANDRAVMAAYGFSLKMSEEDCVAELMKLYQKILIAEKMKKVNKKSKKK